VLKGGASIDFVTYDINKDNDGTPRFLYCAVCNSQTFDYQNPFELNYGTGIRPSTRRTPRSGSISRTTGARRRG
jgi:hypothetical protein